MRLPGNPLLWQKTNYHTPIRKGHKNGNAGGRPIPAKKPRGDQECRYPVYNAANAYMDTRIRGQAPYQYTAGNVYKDDNPYGHGWIGI